MLDDEVEPIPIEVEGDMPDDDRILETLKLVARASASGN